MGINVAILWSSKPFSLRNSKLFMTWITGMWYQCGLSPKRSRIYFLSRFNSRFKNCTTSNPFVRSFPSCMYFSNTISEAHKRLRLAHFMFCFLSSSRRALTFFWDKTNWRTLGFFMYGAKSGVLSSSCRRFATVSGESVKISKHFWMASSDMLNSWNHQRVKHNGNNKNAKRRRLPLNI